MSKFKCNEEVLVLRSNGLWAAAHIIAVHSDGPIDCKFHGEPNQKTLELRFQTPAYIVHAPPASSATGAPSPPVAAPPGQWRSVAVTDKHSTTRAWVDSPAWNKANLSAEALVHKALHVCNPFITRNPCSSKWVVNGQETTDLSKPLPFSDPLAINVYEPGADFRVYYSSEPPTNFPRGSEEDIKRETVLL